MYSRKYCNTVLAVHYTVQYSTATSLNFKLANVLMQGKLFQRCTHFLYCSVLSLGGNVNTRRMSQPDMESIFTEISIKSKETIVKIFKIIKIQCFYPPRILDEHWCIYYSLQSPPRENWFQFVCRVYATANNFPCIITLKLALFYLKELILCHKLWFSNHYIFGTKCCRP